MAFGLKNAGVTVQRALDLMMSLTCEEVIRYLGDLIKFVPMFKIILEGLERVFECLVLVNLRLKLSKCYFRYH